MAKPLTRSKSNAAKLKPSGYALIALLIVAGIWGGGGVAYGSANFLVQLTALAALAAGRTEFGAFWREAPLVAKTLILASIVLPILQLIPLPAAIWTNLPGRELAITARELAEAPPWQSASLDSGRTLVALLSLIVPLAVISLGWKMPRAKLPMLLWAIVGIGVLGFILGIVQVLSQGQSGLLYPENPMPGVLFGTFANRNSAGLFLALAMIALAALPMRSENRPALAAKSVLLALFFIAVLLTRSRSAIVLALVPLAIFSLRSAANLWPQVGRAKLLGLGAIAGAVIMGLLIAQAPGSRLQTSLERFAQTEDPRSYIWDDAAFTAQRYWPAGSGMGTFDDVFQTDQSLENMAARTAGRAHNDYLELAIEAGPVGLLLALGWIAYILFLAWKARHLCESWCAWSAAAGLCMIAAQSVTDYPLRNMTLLALAAVLFLILLRSLQTEERTE